MNKHNGAMMRERKRRLWMLGGAFALACGGQIAGPIVGGESHFLRHCSSSCGDGLSCIQGVCTQSCLVEDEDVCSSLADNARCTNTSIEPGDVAICDVGCQRDLDCGPLGGDYSCDDGYCRGLPWTAGDGSGGNASTLGSGGTPVGVGGTPVGSGGASVESGAGGSTGGAIQDGSSGGTHPTEYPGSIPSCEGVDSTCAGDSCCTSLLVPGGPMKRDGFEYEMRDFYLDKFEVTVGRFRKYMEAVDAWMAAGNPVEGAGAHPQAPYSGFKREWLEDLLPSFAVGVRPVWLDMDPEEAPFTTGNATYVFGGRDDLAVNRVPFHAAFAFCIWDGGRLPTALEWQYVSQGGPNATPYPWGSASGAEVYATIPTAPPPEPELENDPEWEFLTIPVGSHAPSVGLFGHHDLIGGLDEWVRDDSLEVMDAWVRLGADTITKDPYEQLPAPYDRVIVGGNWRLVNWVLNYNGSVPSPDWITGRVEASVTSALDGLRCARDY